MENKMNFNIGNKNIILGLILFLVYLSTSFFIERTSALHGFHSKAASVKVDTKGTEDLLDDEIELVDKGLAYRKGGIYFDNRYPLSYVPVPNFFRDAGINMRLYGWIFSLFCIITGILVGLAEKANGKLRSSASILTFIGTLLYPIRDGVYFWGKWNNPDFSPMAVGPFIYPLVIFSGVCMFVGILLTLVVFIHGTKTSK